MGPQHCMTILLHFSRNFIFPLSKTILDLLISCLNSKSILLQCIQGINKTKASSSHHQNYHPLPAGIKFCLSLVYFGLSVSSLLLRIPSSLSFPRTLFLQLLPYFLSSYKHPLASLLKEIETKISLCLIFSQLLHHCSVLFHSKNFFNFLYRYNFKFTEKMENNIFKIYRYPSLSYPNDNILHLPCLFLSLCYSLTYYFVICQMIIF